MNRVPALLLALAFAPASVSFAQAPEQLQTQPPAPIQRPHYAPRAHPELLTLNPVPGVHILSDHPLQTVSSTDGTVELRLLQGRANVTVAHPDSGTLILLDLPGGQVDLLADGFYTLNADTGTVRVLHGEAQVFPPDAPPSAKGTTVHEAEQVTLTGKFHPTQAEAAEFRADLLQPEYAGGYDSTDGDYPRSYGYVPYSVYPYYAWGWDYPWYPYWGWGPYYAWGPGWGWGAGLGWGWGGYYGGYRGWNYDRRFGYRGGYGGGYHGGYPGGFHPGVSAPHSFSGGGFHGGASAGATHRAR